MPYMSCPICAETYKNEDDIYSTSCGHVFHYRCMQEWRSRSTCCPQCRSHNPSTFKLYLQVEENEEDKQAVIELKKQLEQSVNNASELQKRLEDSEAECNLKIAEIKSELEQSIKNTSELHLRADQSDSDFLNLQKQYNLLEVKLHAVEEENVVLNLMCETKIDTQKGNKTGANSEAMLKQKNLILESRLKTNTVELQKAIQSSTELAVENIKLRSLLAQYTAGALSKPIAQTDIFSGNRMPNQNAALHKPPTGGSSGMRPPILNEGENITSVVISGLKHSVTQVSLIDVVLQLARRMEVDCGRDDIGKYFMLERKHYLRNNIKPGTLTIVVEFKSLEKKVKFLMGKEKLKNNVETNAIILHEFVCEQTNTLYHHAKALRNYGFRYIYCRNNLVMAKEFKTSHAVRIVNKEHVDTLMANFNDRHADITKPNNKANESCDFDDFFSSQCNEQYYAENCP